MSTYTIIEPGKTTTYDGITKTWPQKSPPEAIVLFADEDIVDYFVLDNPSALDGASQYIDDQPNAFPLGVFVPYNDKISVDVSEVRTSDLDVVTAIMHRLPRHLQIAFKALLPA